MNTGIASENPVLLQLRGQQRLRVLPVLGRDHDEHRSYDLGDVHWWSSEGDLVTGSQTGWTRRSVAGVDTVANGGVVLLTNGAEALTGDAPTSWIPAVDRSIAGVWQSGWLSSGAAAPRRRAPASDRDPGNSGQSTVSPISTTSTARDGRL